MNLRLIPKSFHLPLALIAGGVVLLILARFMGAELRSTQSAAQEASDSLDESLDTPAGDLDTSTENQQPQGVAFQSDELVDAGTAFLEPFLYDLREGRRNPFRPPPDIELNVGGGLAGPTGPLERFELDELKIIGIIWDVNKPRVMFVDPNSEVHTAYKDERIGRRRGYIAVIRESEIVVVEPGSYNGETVYSTRILRMSE
jgi:hypothetical protein